jgi:hypothetical protein
MITMLIIALGCVPVLFISWVLYCALVLPTQDDYGRSTPSKAYIKRQQKKAKEKSSEM